MPFHNEIPSRVALCSLLRNCSEAVRMLTGSDFTLIWVTAPGQVQSRHPLAGIEVLGWRHVEAHQLQRQFVFP